MPSELAFSGEGNTAEISGTPEPGTSGTYSVRGIAAATTFKNGAGNIILAADIAITTEAEELTATAGENFSTTVNVEVTLDVHDTDYDEYSYSMEMIDLPEWLSAEDVSPYV